MSISKDKFSESDEVIRKPVVPTTSEEAERSGSDPDRSPIDEENKRDAPVKAPADDEAEVDTVRKPLQPEP